MGSNIITKRPKTIPSWHNYFGKPAGAILILSLTCLAGCARDFPMSESPLQERTMDQQAEAGQSAVDVEVTQAQLVVDTISDLPQSTVAEIVPVYQKADIPGDQSFHLKVIEAPEQKESVMVPVSPRILDNKSIETQMPRVVADLAAKSKMYHAVHSPIKKGESCISANCHQSMTQTRYAHAPIATGDCLVCHARIKEDPPFGLVDNGVDLCWGCHKDQKEAVTHSNYLHKIVKNEGCIGCHDSHGSNTTKYLLKKDELTLCMDCHRKETKKVMSYIETSRVVHKPVAEGRCAGCHAPHSSNFKKLLKEGPDDLALCFSCHIDMAEQAKQASYKHGPIQEGLCTPCHEPHAGYFAKDLKFNFDKKFYNTFDLEVYSLCFKCHKETVVLDKRTEYLTNFRNGDRNLHYLHVNRQKGRTCLACHEVHMGSQIRHIRKSTPFGRWEIPIVFQATPTGGKCSANCHVPKEYDRENPVELLIDREEQKEMAQMEVGR